MSSTGNVIGSTTSGALTGFQLGAMTGTPHAAGVGAVVGAGVGFATSMFGGGGEQEKSKKQQKYKQFIRLTNEENERNFYRNYYRQKDAEKAAIKLYNDEVKRTNRDSAQDARDLVDRRNQIFNGLQKARKQSIKEFDEQIKLNGIQAKMSMNDITRIRNERITDLSFKSQNLIEALDQARLGAKSTIKQLNRDSKILKKSFKIQKTGIKEDFKSTIRDAELQTNDVDNLFKDALEQSRLQAEDIQRQVNNATMVSNIAKEELALARDSKRAEAAFSTQKARMDGLVNEGQQLATGQAGRSATKAIQAIGFTTGIAQNMIADALTRSEAKYELDVSTIANDLRNSREQGQLQIDTINQQLSSVKNKSLNQREKIKAALNTARGVSSRRLKSLSIELLNNQNKISDQKYDLRLDLFGKERQLALNLKAINKSLSSVDTQFEADMDGLKLQLMMANRNAASFIRPKPRRPDPIEPPTKIPRYRGIRMEKPDFDRISRLFNKADRAGAGFNASPFADYLAGASAISSSIVDAAKAIKNMGGPDNPFANNNNAIDFTKAFNSNPIMTGFDSPPLDLPTFGNTSGLADTSNVFQNLGSTDLGFTTDLGLDIGSTNLMQ